MRNSYEADDFLSLFHFASQPRVFGSFIRRNQIVSQKNKRRILNSNTNHFVNTQWRKCQNINLLHRSDIYMQCKWNGKRSNGVLYIDTISPGIKRCCIKWHKSMLVWLLVPLMLLPYLKCHSQTVNILNRCEYTHTDTAYHVTHWVCVNRKPITSTKCIQRWWLFGLELMKSPNQPISGNFFFFLSCNAAADADAAAVGCILLLAIDAFVTDQQIVSEQ